jgi:hypothetical protein
MHRQTASVKFVRDAIEALPSALAATLSVSLPQLDFVPRRIVTTGIGMSEWPARLLASRLVQAGVCALFSVTSRVAEESQPSDLLISFSQGLSPNARLALGTEVAAGARWLVTSIVREHAAPEQWTALEACVARGVTPIIVPPVTESGPLVRLVGPTVAALVALRLAASLAADEVLARQLLRAPSCYRALPILDQAGLAAEAPLGEGPFVLIAAGMQPEWLHAQRWKLLETLLCEDPPVWEALQFAHGPLQATFERPVTLLAFEAGGPSALTERLMRTLHPERQRVLRLCSQLPAALAFFEHTATLDVLLCAQVEASGRDLFDWPARDGDGPLYDLGESG